MKFVLKIATLLLILSCSDKRSLESKEEAIAIDTISFSYHGFNQHGQLDLLSNNAFIKIESIASCFGDARIAKHFGYYTRNGSKICLSPQKVELLVYSGFPEQKEHRDSLEYGPDSLKINTEYQLFEWKNKEYLLSKANDSISLDLTDDYLQFSYYYNRGAEPQESGNYLTRIKKDTTVNVPWDSNNIPKEYRNIFLDEPLSVLIVDRKKHVEREYYNSDYELELVSWRIKINKGADSGVTKGLHFTTKDDQFFIDIDSVLLKESYGTCYIYNMEEQLFRVGTEMRTKWEQ